MADLEAFLKKEAHRVVCDDPACREALERVLNCPNCKRKRESLKRQLEPLLNLVLPRGLR